MELVIKNLCEDFLAGLQLEEATCRVERDSEAEHDEVEHYRVEIQTSDAPLLIGKYGDNLVAFEQVLRLGASKQATEAGRRLTLIVDIDGYRARKAEEAVELAIRRAEEVRRTGNPVRLPPMTAYVRRLVHTEFTKDEWSDITTESAGFGSGRAIVIKKVG